jgi:hypothetical protein
MYIHIHMPPAIARLQPSGEMRFCERHIDAVFAIWASSNVQSGGSSNGVQANSLRLKRSGRYIRLHGIISQTMSLFIGTAVITSNLRWSCMWLGRILSILPRNVGGFLTKCIAFIPGDCTLQISMLSCIITLTIKNITATSMLA